MGCVCVGGGLLSYPCCLWTHSVPRQTLIWGHLALQIARITHVSCWAWFIHSYKTQRTSDKHIFFSPFEGTVLADEDPGWLTEFSETPKIRERKGKFSWWNYPCFATEYLAYFPLGACEVSATCPIPLLSMQTDVNCSLFMGLVQVALTIRNCWVEMVSLWPWPHLCVFFNLELLDQTPMSPSADIPSGDDIRCP